MLLFTAPLPLINEAQNGPRGNVQAGGEEMKKNYIIVGHEVAKQHMKKILGRFKDKKYHIQFGK